MKQISPLQTLQTYRASYLSRDVPAGFAVFLVALPLCLGIALASGAPLFSGLVAGIIGGLLVGTLSGSEISVSGPAAGLAIIVADAIAKVGSYEAFLVAVILAGILQLGLGLLRAGRLSSFFPESVIKGMLVAIGIVIILKQIPHALGRDNDYEGEFEFAQLADGENTVSEIYRALVTASPGAVVISLVSLGFLLLWQRTAGQSTRAFSSISRRPWPWFSSASASTNCFIISTRPGTWAIRLISTWYRFRPLKPGKAFGQSSTFRTSARCGTRPSTALGQPLP